MACIADAYEGFLRLIFGVNTNNTDAAPGQCKLCYDKCHISCECRCHISSCITCDQDNCNYKACTCYCHAVFTEKHNISKDNTRSVIKSRDKRCDSSAEDSSYYNNTSDN